MITPHVSPLSNGRLKTQIFFLLFCVHAFDEVVVAQRLEESSFKDE
jgi:hypothetical protein